MLTSYSEPFRYIYFYFLPNTFWPSKARWLCFCPCNIMNQTGVFFYFIVIFFYCLSCFWVTISLGIQSTLMVEGNGASHFLVNLLALSFLVKLFVILPLSQLKWAMTTNLCIWPHLCLYVVGLLNIKPFAMPTVSCWSWFVTLMQVAFSQKKERKMIPFKGLFGFKLFLQV